jgi:hypothetical protein
MLWVYQMNINNVTHTKNFSCMEKSLALQSIAAKGTVARGWKTKYSGKTEHLAKLEGSIGK